MSRYGTASQPRALHPAEKFPPLLQTWMLPVVVVLDATLSFLVIRYRTFTNIDFETYMAQIRLFLDGERNYAKISGPTGPLPYPAGFLYIYSAIYWITNGGNHILPLQIMEAVLHSLQIIVMFFIYSSTSYGDVLAMLQCLLSPRIRSIFLLRGFNDSFSGFFGYAGVLAAQHDCWNLASILFSLGLSIKMNIIFYLPAFGYLLWKVQAKRGLSRVGHWFKVAALGLAIQILLGLPFLVSFPYNYLTRSFNFSRVFDHQFSVNWQFVPEQIFLSKPFALTLVGLNLSALVVCFWAVWLPVCRAWSQLSHLSRQGFISHALFSSNFIGVLFCWSVHFQFYNWYFSSVPLLLAATGLRKRVRIISVILLEACWNNYPIRASGSVLLCLIHSFILVSVLAMRHPSFKSRQPQLESKLS